MLIFFAILLLLFSSLMVLFAYTSAVKEEQENRMLRSYMLSMEGFYHLMDKKIQAVRLYRHDLRKHIQAISQTAQEDTDNNLICKDEMINSLLILKKEECESKQIALSMDIREPLPKGEMEIISLLCNLLDNAIEANEKIPDPAARMIRLFMGIENKDFVIRISNSMVEKARPSFLTTKDNPSEHGMGLRIIKTILDQRQGKMKILHDTEKKILTMEICFPDNGWEAKKTE